MNSSSSRSLAEVLLPQRGWGRGQRRVCAPSGDEAFRASQAGLSLDGGFQPNWAVHPPETVVPQNAPQPKAGSLPPLSAPPKAQGR